MLIQNLQEVTKLNNERQSYLHAKNLIEPDKIITLTLHNKEKEACNKGFQNTIILDKELANEIREYYQRKIEMCEEQLVDLGVYL